MVTNPDTAFVRCAIAGRIETFVLARALQRYLTHRGIDPEIVVYRPATAGTGHLNHVDVAARLDVATWRDISRWSRRHFHRIHLDQVIDAQLDRFHRFGATGEEPYEPAVT